MFSFVQCLGKCILLVVKEWLFTCRTREMRAFKILKRKDTEKDRVERVCVRDRKREREREGEREWEREKERKKYYIDTKGQQ